MDYRLDAFEGLIKEVEFQGGALLPERCLPESVDYKQEGRTEVPDTFTCGCGNFSRVVSPYAGEGENGNFITACAVCDNVGAWPRYEEAVKEFETDYWDAIKETEE